MALDDARRHRARVMASGLEATSANAEELAKWHATAREVVEGLREEFGPIGLDDDQLAWIAFGTAKMHAMLSALSVAHISETVETSMTVYGLAAGALAGVYKIPGALEAGNDADGAEAPSAPAADNSAGPYL